MKLRIYSIYDMATETFMTPVYAKTEMEAIRGFKDACNGDNQIAHHPEDYSLFYIGEFTDHNADLRKTPTPECVLSGIEAVQVHKEET